MSTPLLRPHNKPAIGAHEIHQDIAEVVQLLDALRTHVNATRLKFGDCAMTRKRLGEAREYLYSAAAFINEAKSRVDIPARELGHKAER